ncbi:Znf771 [Symbiodinium natans]|uniref:Znf771 protein n=1 Tax=Symbiodinium natans TaxID=878477 RepID=A0A812LQU5_9DINO|nr:Znf771 [Symbiodinium natans]
MDSSDSSGWEEDERLLKPPPRVDRRTDVKEARALQACGASFLDPQLLAWRAREAEERLEAEDQSFQREVLEALRAYHAGERRRLRGLGGGLLDLEAEVFKPARLERTVQHLEFAAGSLRRQGLPRRARLLLWLFLNQEHHRLALGENAADTIVRMTRDLRRAAPRRGRLPGAAALPAAGDPALAAWQADFAMVRGRDALSWLGACRTLREDPLRTRVLVFQRELHNMFLAECSAHLREVGRCAVWELRALRITVERMTPCAGRRHALEQSLLRPAARRGRAACDHHVARTLDLVESEPLAVEEDEFRDGEGTLHRMLVCMKGGAGAGGESTGGPKSLGT